MPWLLIQTIPERIAAATRCARPRFSVQTLAASPKIESFAEAMACASESNGITVTTGPKISCRTTGIAACSQATTVAG